MIRIYLIPVCLLAHIGGSLSVSGIGHGPIKPGDPPQTSAALTLPAPDLNLTVCLQLACGYMANAKKSWKLDMVRP